MNSPQLDILMIELERAIESMNDKANQLLLHTNMHVTGINYYNEYVREQKYVTNKMHEVLKELT